LLATPVFDLASFFNFFSFLSLLVFLSNGGYPGFSSHHIVVAGKEAYDPLPLMCNTQK
jgi:hypothetical protein